jgi:predicted Holliday junction resolvase-like endonuclease
LHFDLNKEFLLEKYIILILAIIIILLLIIIRYLWRNRYYLKDQINQTASAKQSLSSRYGKMTEQFMPFLKDYPYDPQNFRFLGSPIDGVQFNDDKIVFIEFKSANSKLNPKQRNIKKLTADKAVEFNEIRIE